MHTSVVVCLVAFSAFGAAKRDAFLERRDEKSLVASSGLSPRARAAWEQGLVTSTEPRLGVPTFFWLSLPPAGARTPRDMGLTAENVARRVLFTHAELYRGEPSRWAEARLTNLHDLGDGGAVIAIFQQEIEGTGVFRDEVKIAMTKDFVPVAIAGYLTPSTKPLGRFSLTPSTAAAAAISAMTGQGVEASSLRPLKYRDGYQFWQFGDEPTPVRARPIWFPLPEGLEPGFYVEVELNEGDTDSRYHSFVVSARTGEVLFENDLTADASFKVWADTTGLGLPHDGPSGTSPSPHPAATPNGFQPPFTAPTLVTREYGPISTMDPWLPAGATRTQGNNTFTYVDSARPNGFGTGDTVPTPNGDPDAGVVFDRTYDPALMPNATDDQRMAAATQLFYDVNFFHDWYYDYGFDERSGNGQTSNLGRGGKENDAINAEGQDNSGRSNANMSTPSDGAAPRMQMYIWTGSATERFTYGTTTVSANGASFGPQSYNVTADVVFVDDGDPSGNGGSVNDGCQVGFVTPVSGKIALVDRGNCTFVQKVQNAQSNGAVGVLIADNTASTRAPELVGSPMPNTTIPAMSMTRTQGTALKTALGNGTVSGTVFRQATVDRDGTIDNAIIAHEWGHYISNRLIGDGNGLSSNQAGGMGEGWGDFHAMLMMVRAEDLMVPTNANWTGVYAVGGYTVSATDQQGYYYGVRRVPYTVDMAKNGLTFKHIENGIALPAMVPTAYGLNGAQNSEVHSTGEVWATMLWECYVSLLRDTQRYTFDQAQDRMIRYLVGGYKLTPIMPTFVEARDAILAAVVARDPQDFALFWAAFARRGIGMQAQAPHRDSTTNRGTVESFVVGNAVTITAMTLDDSGTSCDHDGILDTDEVGMATITVKNVGVGPLAATTVTVSSMSTGIVFPMGATTTVPRIGPFETAMVRVPVGLRGVRGFQGVTLRASATDPSLATPGPVTFDLNVRLNADVKSDGATTDDVEAPMSKWTTGNDPRFNTGSDWRIAVDSPTSHWWFGPNPASPADTFLISPDLKLGMGPVTFTFKHRFEFEADAMTNYDGAVIELSTDGRAWTDLGPSAMPGYNGSFPAQTTNPLRGRRGYTATSMNYPSFVTETVDLGTRYAGQTVKIRFRIGSDDAAAKKGWEVDDIAFTGLANQPFTSITPDPNTCSGNRAPTLNPVMDLSVREGDEVQLTGSGTDPDGDPVTIRFVQREGPMVDLNMGHFVAPSVERSTLLVFEVTAFDGALSSMPQRLTVTVVDTAGAPTVTVPAMIEIGEGQSGSVDASAMDPQGDVVSIRWRQVSGPTVELRDAMTDTVKFTAPYVSEDTTVVFEAIANDGVSDSLPAQVKIVVRDMPLAPANDLVGGIPKGCGCTTGFDVMSVLAALGLLSLRRRRS